jgi:protein phosphatase
MIGCDPHLIAKWLNRPEKPRTRKLHPAYQRAAKFDYVALSDTGRRRTHNEDYVLAAEISGSVLLAVADGVGGAARGSHASKTAIETLAAVMQAADPDDLPPALADAFASAQEAVAALAEGEDAPATTLVAVLIDHDQAWITNVGDSRAYLVSEGRLHRLTDDHSWVAEQVRAGRLTAEEARGNDMRNVITRALGTADARPDFYGPGELASGEAILLCSDGLHGVVPEDEIAQVLDGHLPVRAAASRLIQMANDAGGPDNISVVLFRVR